MMLLLRHVLDHCLAGWPEKKALCAKVEGLATGIRHRAKGVPAKNVQGSVAWRGFAGSSSPAGGLPIGQVGF